MHVAFFTSRNKDNKLEGFKERRVAFLTNKTPEELMDEFQTFVKNGVPGEMSRFYYTLNKRNSTKVQRALQHYLLDHDVDLTRLENVLTSLAGKPENAETKYWLFDYDDSENVEEFVKDCHYYNNLNNKAEELVVNYSKTPNGYAVTVNHGFDTRELLSKWKNVELKRDASVCVAWDTND